MIDKEVIDSRLLFYGFEHFFQRRLIIKELLATKNKTDHLIYSWYLYSRPFISDNMKNHMWDYLHGYLSESDFILFYKAQIKNTQ
jgi:hypothetical protein